MIRALLLGLGALRAAVRAALGLRSGRRRHGDVLHEGRWISREAWERSEIASRNLRRWR